MHNDLSENFVGGSAGATNTYAGLVNFDFGNFLLLVMVLGKTLMVAMTSTGPLVSASMTCSWKGLSWVSMVVSYLSCHLRSANNPWLIEGYYEIPFNEFLTITPALIYGDANFINGVVLYRRQHCLWCSPGYL
jgi:hypothetical protein